MKTIFVKFRFAYICAMIFLVFPTTQGMTAFAQTTTSTFPKGWSGGGKDYKIAPDEQVKRTGKASASIKFIGTTPEVNGFGTITQGIDASQYHGKRIRWSGYIKTSEADKASLWMRVDGKDPKGSSLAFDNMQNGREIRGTQEWRKCEVVLDVSDEARAIYFGCILSGKGQLWVDDLQLEVVGKDVAVTDMTALSREPKNLSFEE